MPAAGVFPDWAPVAEAVRRVARRSGRFRGPRLVFSRLGMRCAPVSLRCCSPACAARATRHAASRSARSLRRADAVASSRLTQL
jgi:hypothetical protein